MTVVIDNEQEIETKYKATLSEITNHKQSIS